MIDWQILGPWLVAALVVLLGLPEWTRLRQRSDGTDDALRYQRDRIREVEGDYDALLLYVWMLLGLFRQHCPDVALPTPPLRVKDQAQQSHVTSRLRRNRARLVRDLTLDELRDAAFDLGFEGAEAYLSRAGLSRALLEFLENRGQDDLFVKWLAQMRPDIQLE